MLTKTKIAGLIVMAMALSSPVVYADSAVVSTPANFHQMGNWHHGPQFRLPSIAKILNLTDDQEKQLQDLHQKQKETMKGLIEQMKSNREAFDAEITKAAPDMGKINDIQTQLKALQSQMVDNHLNSLLDVKKVLTPEQFAGFMALKKEREMMKHECHKGGFEKDRGWNKHVGEKEDQD